MQSMNLNDPVILAWSAAKATAAKAQSPNVSRSRIERYRDMGSSLSQQEGAKQRSKTARDKKSENARLGTSGEGFHEKGSDALDALVLISRNSFELYSAHIDRRREQHATCATS